MSEPDRSPVEAALCPHCESPLMPSGNHTLDSGIVLTQRLDCPKCPVYSEWRRV